MLGHNIVEIVLVALTVCVTGSVSLLCCDIGNKLVAESFVLYYC